MLASELQTTRVASRKGGTRKGRLLRGHTYDHNPELMKCGGSIPTRFQRILMPRDSALIKTSTRFNDQYFYKSLFNKEPGPGTYKPENGDNSSVSFSQKGYGNGFASQYSRDTISTASSYPEIGPGKYDVPAKACRQLVSKVFSYTGRKIAEDDDVLKLNIPFDENNPLNYVKPITLNVYLKPTYPGPGEYDPKIVQTKKGVQCGVPFKSNTERIRSISNKQQTPGVGYYAVKSSFEEYRNSYQRRPAQSIYKKTPGLTYEWLGDSQNIINKSYAGCEDKARAEIVHYDRLHEFQKMRHFKDRQMLADNEKLIADEFPQEVNQSAAFVLDDKDRFGESVLPKKPIEVKPGPGEYEPPDYLRQPPAAVHVFNSKSEKISKSHQRQHPGPAFYNPQKEAHKLSFHLNIAKKWI